MSAWMMPCQTIFRWYEYSTTALQLLSGELDVDIITDIARYYYTAGIFRDLSEFPAIVQALNNPELLDGVRTNCMAPDGSIYGVPFSARYQICLLNMPLFDKLGMMPPSADWTLYDYYELAQKVVKLNRDGPSQAYLRRNNCTDESPPNMYDAFGLMIYNNLLNVGFNSANGYQPRFDTQEMIGLIKMGKELYDIFPYKFSTSQSQIDDECLLWPVDIYNNWFSYFNLTDEQKAMPAVPFPLDIYGNRASALQRYFSIYTLAKNPDDAALFIAEFLDEQYQRENAEMLQLYRDTSRYSKLLGVPQEIENIIITLTKDNAHWAFTNVFLELSHELEDAYFRGEVSDEEYAKALQKGVEQRIMG